MYQNYLANLEHLGDQNNQDIHEKNSCSYSVEESQDESQH